MRRAALYAAGPLLLAAVCVLAAFTTRSWRLALFEGEPVYLPQVDATLTARDFLTEFHPGTVAPRAHSARLVFAAGAETTDAAVAVNSPASFRGHRFHLFGHARQGEPPRPVVSIVLRRFPIRWLLFAGIAAAVLSVFALAFAAARHGPEPGPGPWARRARLAALPVVALSAALVAARTAATGHLPFAHMYEALLFWSFCVALFQLSPRDAGLPGVAVAVGLLAMLLFLPARLTAARPLAPALASPWFTPHIAAAFLGYGGLTAAAVAPRRGLGLPIGFVCLTLAVAFGMVWAEEAWASFWSWDPKEVWSLVTWLLMAGGLAFRLAGRPRGEHALTVLAFLAVLYNFVIVNLVLAGLHSYR